MISTEADVCCNTAAATLPSRRPATPLRWCEPSTIRGALWCSATWTMPDQVGAASTIRLWERKPACCSDQRPMFGGLLRRRPHLCGLGGVDAVPVDRHESDIARLPDADDQRVTPGRELATCLLDCELREVGAVIREDHWTG